MNHPIIQWYPGHIAKAERELAKNLEKIDLVIEVRDARIPIATSHPQIGRWTKGKKHLLVINRRDMISEEAMKDWDRSFRIKGDRPWWCNAKLGTGVKQIQEAAINAGKEINDRRHSRGMRTRPIRALTLGFPNVGKSALINRLVKKKIVASSRKAGITRSLRWVRVGQELDLLDAPGVLPPKLDDQKSALLLALCDDIGEAAYDVETVALLFLEILIKKPDLPDLTKKHKKILAERYLTELNQNNFSPHTWLLKAAELHTSSNTRRMAQRILDDFRKSLLGPISLELP